MVHVQNTQGKKATEGESIRISPKKSSERSNRNDEEVSTRLSWLMALESLHRNDLRQFYGTFFLSYI